MNDSKPILPNAAVRLRAGDLHGALAAATEDVRGAPTDARYRLGLFQLRSVLADWSDASLQLRTAVELDPSLARLGALYQAAIAAEIERERVFRGEAVPTVVGGPEPWMETLAAALRHAAAGRPDAFVRLRDEAFDSAPATAGQINGETFEWIADADTRLGPLLEAVVDGVYAWIPLQRLDRMRIEPPSDLRDRVWLPAAATWSDGGRSNILLPARYPGSGRGDDSALLLGRRTEWQGNEAGPLAGKGQRLLVTDMAEYPLLDVRTLVLMSAKAGNGRDA
jgi:type VI secretion system protein ImpE